MNTVKNQYHVIKNYTWFLPSPSCSLPLPFPISFSKVWLTLKYYSDMFIFSIDTLIRSLNTPPPSPSSWITNFAGHQTSLFVITQLVCSMPRSKIKWNLAVSLYHRYDHTLGQQSISWESSNVTVVWFLLYDKQPISSWILYYWLNVLYLRRICWTYPDYAIVWKVLISRI